MDRAKAEEQTIVKNLAAVKVGNKWGYVDQSGKVVIRPRFSLVFDFCNGLAAVKADERWGYVTTTGQFAIPPQLDAAISFQEGSAQVC